MMARRPGPEGERARAKLEGPEVPDALAYLWERFRVLDGMRTFHMSGPNPITPDAVRAACELYGWRLDRLEMDAIRALDGVIRHPEAGDDDDEPVPVETPAWPDKKGGADG